METVLALGTSVVSLSIATWSYYYAYRSKQEMKSKVSVLESSLEEVKYVENEVFEKSADEEEFKKNISDISERLFNLIKDKYDLEEVTTYQEMNDALENLDVEDDETKQSLQKLFKYFVKIEYSEEELTEEEKAIVRQAAFSLIRTVGPDRLDLKEGSI